jgi:RNA polymerase sigma-70 factor, ECF subfamily
MKDGMQKTAVLEEVSSIGDNALVSSYLEGDEQAFALLMTRYQDRLTNYLHGIIRDYDRSIDLCQEAFIRVFKNAHRYKGQYQFSTWLYRIATNLAIDEIRRRRRRGQFFFYNVIGLFNREERPLPLPDTRHCPGKEFDRNERSRKLQTAIDSLPEKYRLAFVLKEAHDLSYEETAQVLNISLGTVKSRIHRAKLLLRGKLAELL